MNKSKELILLSCLKWDGSTESLTWILQVLEIFKKNQSSRQITLFYLLYFLLEINKERFVRRDHCPQYNHSNSHNGANIRHRQDTKLSRDYASNKGEKCSTTCSQTIIRGLIKFLSCVSKSLRRNKPNRCSVIASW